MRKSERIRQLEFAVIRLEMTVELLGLSISNLLESQGMEKDVSLDEINSLDNGKWYKKPNETP
jgi:hypothetical protein